jgi:hypothetical protein
MEKEVRRDSEFALLKDEIRRILYPVELPSPCTFGCRLKFFLRKAFGLFQQEDEGKRHRVV